MYNCGNPSVRSEWDESLISRLLDCRTHPVRYCIVTTTITPGKEASMNWYLYVLVWWPAGHVRLRFASWLIKLLPVITVWQLYKLVQNPETKRWETCHSLVWIRHTSHHLPSKAAEWLVNSVTMRHTIEIRQQCDDILVWSIHRCS